MLRIHFTSTDLARTQVMETPDPMWEMVLSVHMLHARYALIEFADWRHQVRRDLRRHDLARTTQTLAALAPDGSYFPDFLTPSEGLLGVEEGIEAVVATSSTQVRRELTILHERIPTPSWTWEVVDHPARDDLGRELGRYHRRAIAPYWSTMCDRAAVDRATRTRALRTGGVPALLNSFRPHMRWTSPVLEVNSPVDRDLHLEGRGLTLIPSHFCWNRPVPIANPELPPTLVYPIGRDPQWFDPTPPKTHDNPLARLVGPTRAAILRATTTGPNTTEIARRLDISRATVSQHTAILREAGLITSHRHNNNVLHVITALGTSLLSHSHKAP
jgi:DNA-binding transcriptional ArsR family regulator